MPKVCGFAGHGSMTYSEKVFMLLKEKIEAAIVEDAITEFWVGNYGDFDRLAQRAVKEVQKKYPHIRYAVVLAYMPGQQTEHEDHSDTMLPEGIEEVHPRYAIDWRNRWMLRESQYVLCYIHHHWGGAAKYVQAAQRQGKTVINLCADNVLNGGALK